MVSRIQNRNNGYSEGLFSTKGTVIPNNSYNTSIGATALKLDDQFEVNTEEEHSLITEQENIVENEISSLNQDETKDEGFSENKDQLAVDESLFEVNSTEQISSNSDSALTLDEEYTPKLFSEESVENRNNNSSATEDQKLFDQENNQEDDFEIPAFLRRQKF